MAAELPRFSRQQVEAYLELQKAADRLGSCSTEEVMPLLLKMRRYSIELTRLGLSNGNLQELRILWEKGELQKF